MLVSTWSSNLGVGLSGCGAIGSKKMARKRAIVFVVLLLYCLVSDGVIGNKNKPLSALNDIPNYTTHYFSQYVDHFDFSNGQKFNQKYLVADEYWSSDVMFFYSGNEAPIEGFYENTGLMFELAAYFQALVVFGEHRYYGDSLPFDANETFTPEKIKYLTVEQALVDYATLVQSLKAEYHLQKVIVIGGSYGGILAAWLRFKYPNIFDGALAASAPVYQTCGLTPPNAFFQKVTEDFEAVDSRCPQIVIEAFAELENYVSMRNLEFITTSFKLCKQLTYDKVEHLKGWVRNSFCSLAMSDYPYPTSFLGPLPAYPVKVACDILINSDTKLTGLADAAGLFYNGTAGQLPCYDIDKEFVDCADPTGCGTGLESVAWDYQACTEINLNTITNNITDMFPATKFDLQEYCTNKWGLPLKRSNWLGLNYWINDMSSASNIIFSNGDIDPWSVGGVLHNISDSLIAVVVKRGAHHFDLRSSNVHDPLSVIEAREQERNIIKKWIES